MVNRSFVHKVGTGDELKETGRPSPEEGPGERRDGPRKRRSPLT